MSNSDNDNRLFAENLAKNTKALPSRDRRPSEPIVEVDDRALLHAENERRRGLARSTPEEMEEAQRVYSSHVATYGESKKGDPSKGGGRY